MNRGVMGKFAAAIGVSLLLGACGGGGGGGGLQLGPTDWGIPFVPTSVGRAMTINLRALGNSGAVATIQGYKPNGVPYTGPVQVTLDGDDEHALSITTALGGDTPVGGQVLVHTASRTVEVAFNVQDFSKTAEESSRAWPLGDLAAPPLAPTAALTITGQTDVIQLSNATGAPIVLTVTAYQEPISNPDAPPTTTTPAPIPLAAWETKQLSPATVSGIAGFLGALAFSSTSPFYVATEEDLGFDGTPMVSLEPRQMYVDVTHGQVTAVPQSFTDFAMLVRNDADDHRQVALNDVRLADGQRLKTSRRVLDLAAHESKVVSSFDPLFDDMFGDAFVTSSLTRAWMHLEVPADVNVAFRQFSPVSDLSNMTVRPHPVGHIFQTLDVYPSVSPSSFHTTFSVINPSSVDITVTVESLVPQPDGFDSGPVPIVTLTIPPFNMIDFSPDGTLYFDRDLEQQDLVGFRVRSGSPFVMQGHRAQVAPSGLILLLTPTIIRGLDDAE